jgi:multidrug efflux pump subunit AcrA (membrane-fusion protein)
VSLIIPTLSTDERDSIRMGMGVLVDIELSPPYQALVIPIDAVYISNGKPHVSRLDAAGGTHEVTLTTGITTLHDIEVLEGLKVGDRIVMPDI